MSINFSDPSVCIFTPLVKDASLSEAPFKEVALSNKGLLDSALFRIYCFFDNLLTCSVPPAAAYILDFAFNTILVCPL